MQQLNCTTTYKNYILHTFINVSKEIFFRVHILRFIIYLAALGIFIFLSKVVFVILIFIPLILYLIYLINEIKRSIKYYRFFYAEKVDKYILVFDQSSFYFINGTSKGEIFPISEISLIFDNKLTRSLTLYKKTDNSFVSVFSNKESESVFENFRCLLLKNVKTVL